MAYTVKAVAELAGVSVRALHHYDRIGLLRPASVSPVGYRLYSEADLERLQQVLFFRELGFGLAEIKGIMDNPRYDRKRALREHRGLLLEKRQRLGKLIELIDRTIDSLEGGPKVGEREMFEGFDQKQIDAWTDEARERRGPDNVNEALRRTAHYTKADWEALFSEMGSRTTTIADNMELGPASPAVQAQIARWHHIINERFYDLVLDACRHLREHFGGCVTGSHDIDGDVVLGELEGGALREGDDPGLCRGIVRLANCADLADERANVDDWPVVLGDHHIPRDAPVTMATFP